MTLGKGVIGWQNVSTGGNLTQLNFGGTMMKNSLVVNSGATGYAGGCAACPRAATCAKRQPVANEARTMTALLRDLAMLEKDGAIPKMTTATRADVWRVLEAPWLGDKPKPAAQLHINAPAEWYTLEAPV
jgi:hypothetical protein